MGFKQLFTALITTLALCQTGFAEEVPVQFSTYKYNSQSSEEVRGFRLSVLHGKTRSVNGLDMAVFGLSEVDKLEGVAFNPFFGASKVNKEFEGVALSLVNWHEGRDTGANIAFVNHTNQVKGVNFGMVNLSQTVAGANIGAVNHSERYSVLDFGAINYAKSAKFQIGIFNVTENLQGLQVGLLNYAENGVVQILPLINFRKSF